VPVVKRDEFLGGVRADPDHHQQAHFVLLQPDLEVHPVDPAVDVSVPASDRLLNVVASSCQS
jgi:hypothetical protein